MNPLMNSVGSNAEGKLNCINAVVITHHRTLKMIQFLVSYFLSLQHRNKSSVQPRDRNN